MVREQSEHDSGGFFRGEVHVVGLDVLDSQEHELLQLADLFSGSISRVLNRAPNGSRNQKDEMAEAVCEMLSIDPDSASLEVEPDLDWVMTYVFQH